MTLRIRELPPLRHSVQLITPSDRSYRWADDEPDPANIPGSLRHSSTMPGGYASSEAVLARRPGVDYADLERLSTKRVLDATGGIVSETRLERAPRTSGDHMAISPAAAGWQAHLEDDKSAHALIIDRRLSPWQGMSRARRVVYGVATNPQNDGVVTPDSSTGQPAIKLEVSGHIPGSSGGVAESVYDAGDGNLIGQVQFESTELRNTGGATWGFALYSDDDDAFLGSTSEVGSLVDSVAFRREDLIAPRRWLMFQIIFGAAHTADENERWRMVKHIAVIGDHGLPVQQIAPGEDGILASDIVRYAVQRFAPKLRITSDSIEPSSFPIPHLDPFVATTAAEMVQRATRFGLQDWAVWDDFTFYWHRRGSRGRTWRARIAPSQLEETGPQIDRLWESVVVTYQDVDGSTRTVGPPGSGGGTEDARLKDADPENPANKVGIIRRATLAMGTSTAAGAIELGRRFLEEQKLLDSSGRARFVGHVEDDRGVLHPYSHVKGGDNVVFVDASDPSPRRIVRVDHDHPSRSCQVDLDSPPEGLDALLERLGVVLVGLGL